MNWEELIVGAEIPLLTDCNTKGARKPHEQHMLWEIGDDPLEELSMPNPD